MNDERIVELIRTGRNDRALDALYRNFPAVHKLISSKGGTKADAQDIFQEALIILVGKIRNTSFKLTVQLSTYLFSVCRFLWKDELKKRNLTGTYDIEGAPTDPPEQEITNAIEDDRIASLAEKALDELKERCKELLLLFYQRRWKLKDIAAKMGYNSENTAKNQKYKCLEAAKNRLKELRQTVQTS